MPKYIPRDELVRIAKRDNNKKRAHLLVNPLQGKHIPVSPRRALSMFDSLAQKLFAQYPNEKLLIIGFAETATAIGAAIACAAPQPVPYIQTTRESPDSAEFLFFSEIHCHAVEQKIAKNHLEDMVAACDRIVFAEDEVTTGNTILNIISVLKRAFPTYNLRFGVASILNCMDKIHMNTYRESEIHCTYLMKLPPGDFTDVLAQYSFEGGQNVICGTHGEIPQNTIVGGKLEARLGVSGESYLAHCRRFADSILQTLASDELKNKRILVLGAEEFMFPALLFAAKAESECAAAEVRFHATTRSPILTCDDASYPLFSRYQLHSLYDSKRKIFVYNLAPYDIVFVLHDAPQPSVEGLCSLVDALQQNHCSDIRIFQWAPMLQSSYSPADVTLLLKDLSGKICPMSTEEREKKIQSGTHYCEMLPQEYRPSREYLKTYQVALENYAEPTAQAVHILSDKILKRKGKRVVLVSLARAGIPIGILLKHDLQKRHRIVAPHYSISIIRGRGIDYNALQYILERHPAETVQFVDGWIGKGAIQNQLYEALRELPQIDASLAVLADPANLGVLCGTHEDLLIPSSCLNSTVSGLISRTVLRDDLISETDFHGAVFYQEYAAEDVSYPFIHSVEAHFKSDFEPVFPELSRVSSTDIENICKDFEITNRNLIKPGIGEATRVLLRRLPWKVLISQGSKADPVLDHLLRLASEKNVPVEVYPLQCYKACGIIQNLADI